MKIKAILFSLVLIIFTSLIGCNISSSSKYNSNKNTSNDNEISDNNLKSQDNKTNISSTVKPELKPKTDNSIIPTNTSQPFIGRMNLDSETENFFYGTWKVKKLIGFANSYNDASEYPTGQKVIGDEIIIKKDFFSSKGLENYNVYQYELKNPLYDITAICYNSDSFYRLFKIKLSGLNINDEVKQLEVSDSSTKLGIPGSFFVVNNDRLILMLEATCFELKKVTD